MDIPRLLNWWDVWFTYYCVWYFYSHYLIMWVLVQLYKPRTSSSLTRWSIEWIIPWCFRLIQSVIFLWKKILISDHSHGTSEVMLLHLKATLINHPDESIEPYIKLLVWQCFIKPACRLVQWNDTCHIYICDTLIHHHVLASNLA